MQYMLLIYDEEAKLAAMTADESQAFMGEYARFSAAIAARGALVAGDALKPTSTATSVRVRDGATLLTDGPFAETREQLGGYYLIEAPDLDRALEIAAQIPSARTGTIEVRPVQVFRP